MATELYEVTLTPEAQRFNITILGIAYQFTLLYRDALRGAWILDIADADGNELAAGIPLVTGHDLLEQHKHKVPGFKLFVSSDGDNDAIPTYANLGTLSHMWISITT